MGKHTTRSDTKRIHFTERRLAALPVPSKLRTILYDAKVFELGLKVEPTGTKTFFWFRAVPEEEQPKSVGKPTWKTIGKWPDIELDDARRKAEQYNGLLANWKKDGCPRPSPFRVQRGEWTLGTLAEEYVARHLRARAHHPAEAERDFRYRLEAHLAAWKGRGLATINRKDVLDLHSTIGEAIGHYQANAVLELVSRLYNFALKQELWKGENPARNVKRFHEEKRARFVQPDEMPKLFAALKTEPNPDVVDFVNLSLWTGARKSDVLSMRWQDISLDDNRWLVPDPKNREPYQVALTPEAVAILKNRKNDSESSWVFPSFGKTGHLVDLKNRWTELLKRAGIANLRQHDLRRTLGSWQAAQGASLQIIGKSLGHKSQAATAIYSRLNLDPVRESVNAATKAMLAASQKQLPVSTQK